MLRALSAAILKLVEDSWQRGWWTAYGDAFNGSFHMLEDQAPEMCIYETTLIPGPFQTSDYARVILRQRPDLDEDDLDRLVAVRLRHRPCVRPALPYDARRRQRPLRPQSHRTPDGLELLRRVPRHNRRQQRGCGCERHGRRGAGHGGQCGRAPPGRQGLAQPVDPRRADVGGRVSRASGCVD